VYSSCVIGKNRPVYIIGEIGINHNGDIDIALRLLKEAKSAGCNAVKFQKRTPVLCVPEKQKNILRQTPWGILTYLEYKERLELNKKDYIKIDNYARKLGIDWFVSYWDIPSISFMDSFSLCYHKIPSACITDLELLREVSLRDGIVIMSTGMSSLSEIQKAVDVFSITDLCLLHTTSSYPCCAAEINLRMIQVFQQQYSCLVGYSGHERGIQISLAAVAMGAKVIERHITLDRTMWGTDQASSLEIPGLRKLIRDIRVIEDAMGDGVKKIYTSELSAKKKLRRK